MMLKRFIATSAVAFVAGASMLTAAAVAAQYDHDFDGKRVVVESAKSFDQVVGSLKSLVAENGMMVMAEVDQGNMLSMTGLRLKATLFLVGNPTIGKQLFEQDHGVGLYLPMRVFVTEQDGKTFIAYDTPSSSLGQFKNDEISMVAKMLDEKLAGLAMMAAK